MTWLDIERKYPEDRSDMTEERERQFVNDCFDAYEAEGFSKVFQTPYDDYSDYNGKPFEVIGRTPIYDGKNKGSDLECLPLWSIRFEDGKEITAYPEEIVAREVN